MRISYRRHNRLAAKIMIAAAVFFTNCIGAQAQTMQASKSHYSTDDGLCSNAISNIVQDDYG